MVYHRSVGTPLPRSPLVIRSTVPATYWYPIFSASDDKMYKSKKNIKLYRVFSSHKNILRILTQKKKFNKLIPLRQLVSRQAISHQITIKELMIMLLLHGQNTAVIQCKVSGQAILQKLTRKDIFGKRTDMKFCLIPEKKLTSKCKTT